MTAQPDYDPTYSFKLYSLMASAMAMALGLLVLAGWWFDVAVLKSVFPGLATMKSNTALCFLLSGVSLYLLRKKAARRYKQIIAEVCASLVMLIGLLTFVQYLFDWEFGIDLLLFQKAEIADGTLHPDRMPPASAIGFLAVGLAALMLDARRARWLVQILILLPLFISLIAVTGYIYDVKTLYSIYPYSSMALHTAIGFILISTGVMSVRPEGGIIAVIVGNNAGGIMARRLLPAVTILPLATGWLNLLAAQRGVYSPEFRIAVLTVTSITVFSALIWLNARSLYRMDSERMQAEKKFKELLESAPDAMVIVNEGGYIALVNSQTEKMFGYRRERLLGQKVEVLVPEAYRREHSKHRAQYFADPQMRYMGQERELHGRRKDGSEFPISVSLSPLVTKEGTLVTAAIRDITDRKLAEEALAQKAAELARSNAELSQFAYVASHDLQEPLRAIAGCVELLQRRFQGDIDPRTQELISHTVDGASRMQSLINDLLTLSRVGARGEPFQRIPVSDAIERALANLRVSIAESGAIVTQDPLPEVMADPTQMVQLFQNLIGNAIKFRRDQPPRIVISTELSASESKGAPDSVRMGKYDSGGIRMDEWVFSVRDNGIGVAPEYRERIFGVFQRLHTRKEYPGTGIGLAICKKIVERHGGRIWVESIPGEGSTFHFTLPNGGPPIS